MIGGAGHERPEGHQRQDSADHERLTWQTEGPGQAY